MNKRVFCFENDLGFIKEGIFYPIHLDKLEFMRIICTLRSNTDYISADLLLKDAIKNYTNIDILAIQYKNKSLSDSVFYMYWLNKIRNNRKFKLTSSALKEEKKRINKKIKEESKKYKIPKAYNVQSTEKILRNNGFSRYNKNK